MDPLFANLLMLGGAYCALTFSPLLLAVPVMLMMPTDHQEAGNWLGEIFVRWLERKFPLRLHQYMLIPLVLPIGFWLIGLGHLVLLVAVVMNRSRERGANACYFLQELAE